MVRNMRDVPGNSALAESSSIERIEVIVYCRDRE